MAKTKTWRAGAPPKTGIYTCEILSDIEGMPHSTVDIITGVFDGASLNTRYGSISADVIRRSCYEGPDPHSKLTRHLAYDYLTAD
jgi:hypothetical protein